MTLPTYSTPFTDDVSTVSADFLNNYVRTQIPKALDGVGGSVGVASTPVTSIDVGGAGIEMSGPLVLVAGGDMDVETGVTVQLKSGSTLDIDSGASVTRQGSEVLSGVGATTAWRTVDGADADTTYDVTYDEVRVPEVITSGGGLVLYTLRHSTSPTPTVGNRIRFSRNGAATSGSARILREGAVLLATLSAGGYSFAEFCYMTAPTDVTARWRLVAAGGSVSVFSIL